jgi:hypothetical protein
MKDYDIEPHQTWIVDRFRPEDAPGVTQLFRAIYGDGYPIRHFVEPDKLIEENLAQRLVSSVARTPKGDIVGHNALFHSAPSEKIFESGAGLVHPLYSGGKGIFTDLGMHGIELAVNELQASALWGEPVCNHIFAQKAIRSVGWECFAVEVDLMPASAYTKDDNVSGRVSTLMFFDELHPRQQQVFVPRVYDEWMKAIYTKLKTPRDILVSTAGPKAELKSDIKVQVFDFAQVARIIGHVIGEDFGNVFDEKQMEALNQKAVVLQVWLPLSDPAASWAVDHLRRQGYFFGGLLPRWFDDDGMLMQKITGRPNWESMRIADDWSMSIVDMAKTDWKAVTTEPHR